MKWKITVDTGCDLRSMERLAEDTAFSYVPLKIEVGDKEFIDTADLDTKDMMKQMHTYQGKTSTACPSPGQWEAEFREADNIFAITITGGLSGSYNSAKIARDMILEEYPNKNIYIIDSLSAGPELTLIANEINRLIEEHDNFDTVCNHIDEYRKHIDLLFCLENLDNLIKNGRISKLQGAIAGILGIRIVGCASTEGTLELLHKCRGKAKAYSTIISELKERGYVGGRVIISHNSNEDGANFLKTEIQSEFVNADVIIMSASGLCSYYAEDGGMLIGYERN